MQNPAVSFEIARKEGSNIRILWVVSALSQLNGEISDNFSKDKFEILFSTTDQCLMHFRSETFDAVIFEVCLDEDDRKKKTEQRYLRLCEELQNREPGLLMVFYIINSLVSPDKTILHSPNVKRFVVLHTHFCPAKFAETFQ